MSTEIPKSSAVEFSNLCCAKVCDVFAKKYSNKYAMKKSSRENADGLVQRSILKLQNNSFLIHISYGTVVRDFESEAKTRCNFQFR